MNKRLFTFGCSYTHFAWPTWADLIAVHGLDYNIADGKNTCDKPDTLWRCTYNFGRAGSCNQEIINRVLMANELYDFCETDVICVQWTSQFRHSVPHTITQNNRVDYADPAHSITACYWQEVHAHTLLRHIAQTCGATVYEFDFDNPETTQVLSDTDCDTALMNMMINTESSNLDWRQLRTQGGYDAQGDDFHSATQHIDAHPSPQQHLCVARAVLHQLELGEINSRAVEHAQLATEFMEYMWAKGDAVDCSSSVWQNLTQSVRKLYVAEIHASLGLDVVPSDPQDAYYIQRLLNRD
jgi:hypothetical protein